MATLNILYEDPHILVCVKPHGIATQSKSFRYPDMVSLIKNHLAKASGTSGKSGAPKSIGSRTPGSAEPYLAVIHRLDQPVAGILVFAKTPAAAKDLNKQLQNQGFGKYYRALVTNAPSEKEGTLEDYMVKDARTNTSRICSAKENGAKIARLHYDTVPDHSRLFSTVSGSSSSVDISLSSQSQECHETELEIHLDTGRHHQIRVQLASIGCPIVGDTKYNPELTGNKGWQTIRLCAYKLDFKHPVTHKAMHFQLEADPKKRSGKFPLLFFADTYALYASAASSVRASSYFSRIIF